MTSNEAFEAWWESLPKMSLDTSGQMRKLPNGSSLFEHEAEAVWQACREANRAERPTIVCLCGSTRFMEAFQEANLSETLAGRIVLSVGCNTKSDASLGLAAGTKEMLDRLHKQKIDLADEVLVLNVGGYIGDSTRSEIEHAKQQGKPIRYLEAVR